MLLVIRGHVPSLSRHLQIDARISTCASGTQKDLAAVEISSERLATRYAEFSGVRHQVPLVLLPLSDYKVFFPILKDIY